jgi:aspartyl-tRNA(Asn)/glutamyl-tRNA(Gln) amidotransferase subunit A
MALSGSHDPRALVRIRRGERHTLHPTPRRSDGFDAFICPAVPAVARPLAALDVEVYARADIPMLRNPTVVNPLNKCASSLPMHEREEPQRAHGGRIE